MKTATVAVPDYKIERVPVPRDYLTRYCAGVKLSSAATTAEFEDVAARLWICVQDHNKDKDAIEGLK